MALTEAPYTGLTALVKLGPSATAKVLAYISGCTLNLSKDIIEILQFGADYKEKVPAIKDWSLSVDGTVALADGGTQEEFYDAFESGLPLTVGLYLDPKTYFEGTGFVSSFEVSGAPDDKMNLTSEIAGSGSVRLTLPSTAVINNLTVSSPGNSSAELTWTAPTEASGIIVQQSLNGIGGWVSSTTEEAVTPTSTSAKATGLKSGTPYWFRLYVYGKNPGYSNVVTTKTTA